MLRKSNLEWLRRKRRGLQSICESVKTAPDGFCDDCHKPLESEDIENAGKVVAKRHQAPFAADLVEATEKKVSITRAAFERSERMLDNGGTAAHQFFCFCALHPRPMTFEDLFVLPAADASVRHLGAETTCL